MQEAAENTCAHARSSVSGDASRETHASAHLGIGIDTGGTFTDAVIFDFAEQRVLATHKARTTKEDLSRGILAAIDGLPSDLVQQAERVALSTTLATNACSEGKGGRAKLVLLGTNEQVLRNIDAESRYGFSLENLLPLENRSSFDGTKVDHPDWREVFRENAAFFSDAQALGIVEMNASRNGGEAERRGKRELAQMTGVPVVMASDISKGVNMMERGATALLNARLLPIVEEFLEAVRTALTERGIGAQVMIVLSDGGLVDEDFARAMPVETIISGPAASVCGSRHLAKCPQCLIVDIGGTTTDVSLVRAGLPVLTNKVRIGDWRIQVPGVYVDTFALGGDTVVSLGESGPALGSRRVEPLCAAATRWPELIEQLEALLASEHRVRREMYEVLYLLREPTNRSLYNEFEQALIDALANGPMVIGCQERFDARQLMQYGKVRRLEDEGIIMRAGLTPTDMMHLVGDFTRFEVRASELAARYFCEVSGYDRDHNGVKRSEADDADPFGIMHLAAEIYDQVECRLFVNLARLLVEQANPGLFDDGTPKQFTRFFEGQWKSQRTRMTASDLLQLSTELSIVGVGAPTHVFLPAVARALGARCIIPENAEVANAVGAITAQTKAQVGVSLSTRYDAGGVTAYLVYAADKVLTFSPLEERQALEAARREAIDQAERLARSRGATGTLHTTVEERSSMGTTGAKPLHLGTTFVACAVEE